MQRLGVAAVSAVIRDAGPVLCLAALVGSFSSPAPAYAFGISTADGDTFYKM